MENIFNYETVNEGQNFMVIYQVTGVPQAFRCLYRAARLYHGNTFRPPYTQYGLAQIGFAAVENEPSTDDTLWKIQTIIAEPVR